MFLSVIVPIVLLFNQSATSGSRVQLISDFRNTQKKIYQELGVELRLIKIVRVRKDPTSFLDADIYSQLVRLSYWRKHIYLHYRKHVGAIKFVVLGCKQIGEKCWASGAAEVCGLDNPYPTGFAMVRDSLPAPELNNQHNIIFMGHEIGHILGAKHDTGEPNIMDPAAGRFIGNYWPIPFSAKSQAEVRVCIEDSSRY